MIHLIVLSKYQDILDIFLNTILPTISQRKVKVYIVSEKLKFIESSQIIRVDRTEFHPPKYFNKIIKTIPSDEYVGIVNDDILCSRHWYNSVCDMLNINDCVSPGFYETTDHVEAMMYLKDINEGTWEDYDTFENMFMPFYVFSKRIVDKIGLYDETLIDYFDLDWLWRTQKAGYEWMTASQISIVHIPSSSRKREMSFIKKMIAEYRPIFIKKCSEKDFSKIKEDLKRFGKNRALLHI